MSGLDSLAPGRLSRRVNDACVWKWWKGRRREMQVSKKGQRRRIAAVSLGPPLPAFREGERAIRAPQFFPSSELGCISFPTGALGDIEMPAHPKRGVAVGRRRRHFPSGKQTRERRRQPTPTKGEENRGGKILILSFLHSTHRSKRGARHWPWTPK